MSTHAEMNTAFALAAVVAFNLPVGLVAWKLRRFDFVGALNEKSGDPASVGMPSYSRITGMIGAVIVTALFWMISNVVVFTAITDPEEISQILSHVGALFLVGSALFLPYAFNQLKAIFTN